MNKEQKDELIIKMYELIKQENGLPIPTRILIRQPTQGKCLAQGRAIKNRINTEFRLSVTVSKPLYVEDENGRFFHKKNKNIHYRCEGWKPCSRENVIHTAAHEIAHLKFWNHNAEHLSYMNYLNEKLTSLLEGWNYGT